MNTEIEVTPEVVAEQAYLAHVRGSIDAQAARRRVGREKVNVAQ